MNGSEKIYKGDAKTRYALDSFVPKNATQIKLTNDERKQLLTMFNPRKQVFTGIILLAFAFCAFIMGIVFCAVLKVSKSLLGIMLCQIPGVILLIVGIYIISTAPKIEKSIIKAYEFSIEKMKHLYLVRVTRYNTYYQTEDITSITLQQAYKYGLGRAIRSEKRYYLHLQLDGKWVEVTNAESYAPLCSGIKTGDKVRCAVLECDKYCYISLY